MCLVFVLLFIQVSVCVPMFVDCLDSVAIYVLRFVAVVLLNRVDLCRCCRFVLVCVVCVNSICVLLMCAYFDCAYACCLCLLRMFRIVLC